MHNSIIAIDNNAELEAIESQHPECSTSTLVLLSNHFSLQQLESYQDRKYIYFYQKMKGGGLLKRSIIFYGVGLLMKKVKILV
jgi:hypothetical protein